jgi:hypothetical protein
MAENVTMAENVNMAENVTSALPLQGDFDEPRSHAAAVAEPAT